MRTEKKLNDVQYDNQSTYDDEGYKWRKEASPLGERGSFFSNKPSQPSNLDATEAEIFSAKALLNK